MPVLHTGDPGSMPSAPYGPLSPPAEIHEHRSRSKSWALLDVAKGSRRGACGGGRAGRVAGQGGGRTSGRGGGGEQEEHWRAPEAWSGLRLRRQLSQDHCDLCVGAVLCPLSPASAPLPAPHPRKQGPHPQGEQPQELRIGARSSPVSRPHAPPSTRKMPSNLLGA